ncbi:hypothetical protein MMPV_002606 [Pyropia vietnamensis]
MPLALSSDDAAAVSSADAASAAAGGAVPRRRPRQVRWWRPLAFGVALMVAATGVMTPAVAADETVVLRDGVVEVRSSVPTGTTLRLALAGVGGRGDGGGGGGTEPPAPPPAGSWMVEAAFLDRLSDPAAGGAALYPPADAPSLALMAATGSTGGGGLSPPEPRVAVEGNEPLVAGAYGPSSRVCKAWEPCVVGASVADVAALLTRSPVASVVVNVLSDEGGVPTVVLAIVPGVSLTETVLGGSVHLRLRARRVLTSELARCVTPWAVGGVTPPGVTVPPTGDGDAAAIAAALPPVGPDVVCSDSGTCNSGVCACNATRAGPYCGAPITPLGTNRTIVQLTMEPRTSRYFSIEVTNAVTRASRSRLLVSLALLGGPVPDAGCALRMAYRPPTVVQPPAPAPGYSPGVLPSRSLVPHLRDLYRIRSTVRLLTPPDEWADFPTGSTVLVSVDHTGAPDRRCPSQSAAASASVALLFEECAGEGCPQAVVGGLRRLVWTALIASSFLLAVSATAYLWHRFMSRGRASAPIARHDRLSPAEADRMLPVFPYSPPAAAEAVRTAAEAVVASEAAAAAAAAAASRGRVAMAVAAVRRRLGWAPRVEVDCADPEVPSLPSPSPPLRGTLATYGNGDAAAGVVGADAAAAAAVAAAVHDGGTSSSSDSDSDSSSSDSHGALSPPFLPPTLPRVAAPSSRPPPNALCVSRLSTPATPCGPSRAATPSTPTASRLG